MPPLTMDKLIISLGGATSGGPSLVVPSYLGQVATGTYVADSLHASNTYGYGRNPHISQDNITSLQLVFGNWYLLTGAETNGTNTCAYTAAIEYPVGVFTQVLFSGIAQGTVASGANLISDACSVSIPRGAKFWTRIWTFSSLGKVKYFQYYAGDGTAQCQLGTSAIAIPDVTMGGGLVTNPALAGTYVGPIAIIANTTRPSVGFYGDSIAVGRGDGGDDTALQSYGGRCFGQYNAVMNVGRSGETLVDFIASHTKRVALAQYVSHLFLEYGLNDVVLSSRSAAQVQADTNTVLAYFTAVLKKAVGTLTPDTTSTDNWGSVANQTATAFESVRQAVNTQRISTMPAGVVTYDVCSLIEDTPGSGKWSITPGGMTADGTHPSRLGYRTIASGMNPSTLIS